MGRVQHYYTLPDYKTGSHCDFSSCNDFIIHMYARMVKDIQVQRQQINSINI